MKKLSKIVLLCSAPLMAMAVTPDKPAGTNAPAAAASPNATKPAISADSLFADTVVAKGKGLEVKRNELDSEVINGKAMYASRGTPAPAELETQALRGLIIKQLILKKATAEDLAKGKTAFDENLAKLKKNSGLSEDEFKQKLNQQLLVLGLTKDQWEKQNAEQATIPIVLQRELKIKVTDEDVKKFYDDNPAKFEEPEMVRAAHILLMTQDSSTQEPLSEDKKQAKHKQIEDLLKRARGGEDFAELAKKYSEDPGSKEKGGEYTFPRGRMVPEFETAAFSLKTNEVSDVVTTQYGYHIIKLYEKIPAKKVELSTVKDEIKDYLTQTQIQKDFAPFAKTLIKDANVEVLDEKLKGAVDVETKESTTNAAPKVEAK